MTMDNISIMCCNLCYVTSEHESYLKYRYFLYLSLLMVVNMYIASIWEKLWSRFYKVVQLHKPFVRWANYIPSSCKFPIAYICQKLCKFADSRQSYCKNCQAYFFGPPCISGVSGGGQKNEKSKTVRTLVIG